MENQIKEALAKYEALIREQLARNEKIKAQRRESLIYSIFDV